MFKKSVVLLTLLLASAVGCQFFSQYQYQQQAAQLLAQLNQQHSWSYKQTITHKDWLSRQEQWQIEGNLADLGLEPYPFSVVLQHKVRFWPLWLSGEWQVDASQGDYQHWLRDFQLSKIPHLGQWQANILTQSLKQTLSIDDFEHTYPQLKLHFKSLQLSATSDLNFSAGTAEVLWQGMLLDDNSQNGDHIHLGQVKAEEHFSQRQGWTLVENAKWSIDELKLQLEQGETELDLKKLAVTNQFSEQQQRAYMSVNSSLEQFSFKEAQQRFKLNDLILTSKVGGVPMQSLVALANANQQQGSEQNLDGLVQHAVSEGLEWQLDQLALKVNSNFQNLALVGDIHLSGTAKLLPFELTAVNSPLQLLRYLDLNVALDTNDTLFNYSPLSSYIMALRTAGYVINQNGRDQSKLIFNDSEFTMNNLPVN
ncbi:DUF945 family protein [Agarivorans litoreus]|uniref:DUF945 family protein n=1 Tax=Agarivorans litoreus TaxID=1510455 RepID=UPI001C7DB008|nr:DUF945 family protein [Agarivorans litoreus]